MLKVILTRVNFFRVEFLNDNCPIENWSQERRDLA